MTFERFWSRAAASGRALGPDLAGVFRSHPSLQHSSISKAAEWVSHPIGRLLFALELNGGEQARTPNWPKFVTVRWASAKGCIGHDREEHDLELASEKPPDRTIEHFASLLPESLLVGSPPNERSSVYTIQPFEPGWLEIADKTPDNRLLLRICVIRQKAESRPIIPQCCFRPTPC